MAYRGLENYPTAGGWVYRQDYMNPANPYEYDNDGHPVGPSKSAENIVWYQNGKLYDRPNGTEISVGSHNGEEDTYIPLQEGVGQLGQPYDQFDPSLVGNGNDRLQQLRNDWASQMFAANKDFNPTALAIGAFAGGLGLTGQIPGLGGLLDAGGGGALEGAELGAGGEGLLDVVGSDWAAGLPSAMNGGLLPTTAGGLTAGNVAAQGLGPGVNGTIPATMPNISGPQTPNATVGNPLPNVPPGSGTALSRFLDGNASTEDYLSLAGGAGSTLLGLLGSQEESGAMSDVANRYLELGSPFRSRLLESYGPNFNYADTPDVRNASQQATNDMLRGLSAKFGNPADSPSAQGELLTQSINRNLGNVGNYRRDLGQFGGLGLNVAGQADISGASNSGDLYNSLGWGLGQATQQQSPLQEFLRQQSLRMNTGTV